MKTSSARFPVGWEAELVQRSILAQRCATRPLVLHSDNGAPMKSYSLKATMEALGIVSSHSRPRVSNDNPFSESLFRTLKYWPKWPRKGFASLEQARQWVKRFIHWYCHEHRHSGIRFVTPAQQHQGLDKSLPQRRHMLYQAARNAHPERWSGATRKWDWISYVHLNPDRQLPLNLAEERLAA